MALLKDAGRSLAEQLTDRFAERIGTGLLAPGARLPSVRQCAGLHGVSTSTVVAAYDRLLALGLVQARPQRGFFVREAAGARVGAVAAALSVSGAGVGARADALDSARARVPVNAAALIRGMFHSVSDKPQPGMGVFPPDWLDGSFMQAALRKVTTRPALAELSLQYGEPAGEPALRRVLVQRLAELDIHASLPQVITTVGATHALDIISRTLLRPGEPVMVEEPGWVVEYARLAALGMQVLPVARTARGPDLATMERYCELHRPKLFVSVSVLHNPTGHSLSPSAAHRVVQLAHRYGFHVVEDDTYSQLAAQSATRLCALDGLQRTVYVSGFAKVLAPNWRVGYLVAPPALVDPLLDTKLLTTLTTPALLERALAWCIEQGQLRRHVERLRERLDQARARSVALALRAGCRFAAEPAGLFGWVDTGVDTDALAQRMLDQGYLLAPGSLFHARRGPSTLMRINFATTQDGRFWRDYCAAREGM